MSKYKLTYFNGCGQAEFIRWMFEIAEVEYEDDRFEASEWRPKRKSETPFGQVPTLQVDGSTLLCQRHAIGRFLARKFGLGGEDELADTWVDMVALCVDDTRKPIEDIRFTQDPSNKAERLRRYEENELPVRLTNLEKMHRGGDFFLGEKLTWCDLVFVSLLEWFDGVGVRPGLHAYPRLSGVRAAVLAHPRVSAWRRRRPDTAF